MTGIATLARLYAQKARRSRRRERGPRYIACCISAGCAVKRGCIELMSVACRTTREAPMTLLSIELARSGHGGTRATSMQPPYPLLLGVLSGHMPMRCCDPWLSRPPIAVVGRYPKITRLFPCFKGVAMVATPLRNSEVVPDGRESAPGAPYSLVMSRTGGHVDHPMWQRGGYHDHPFAEEMQIDG